MSFLKLALAKLQCACMVIVKPNWSHFTAMNDYNKYLPYAHDRDAYGKSYASPMEHRLSIKYPESTPERHEPLKYSRKSINYPSYARYVEELNELAVDRPALRCAYVEGLGVVLDPGAYYRMIERAKQRAASLRFEDFCDAGEKRCVEAAMKRSYSANFDKRLSTQKPERRATPIPGFETRENSHNRSSTTEKTRYGFSRSLSASQPALPRIPARKSGVNPKNDAAHLVQPRWR